MCGGRGEGRGGGRDSPCLDLHIIPSAALLHRYIFLKGRPSLIIQLLVNGLSQSLDNYVYAKCFIVYGNLHRLRCSVVSDCILHTASSVWLAATNSHCCSPAGIQVGKLMSHMLSFQTTIEGNALRFVTLIRRRRCDCASHKEIPEEQVGTVSFVGGGGGGGGYCKRGILYSSLFRDFVAERFTSIFCLFFT